MAQASCLDSPIGRLHGEVGGDLGEEPEHNVKEHVSSLAWEHLGVPPEDLAGGREVGVSL